MPNNKYNLPPYQFCNGGKAADKSGTPPDSGDPGTDTPKKIKVGESEYTEEQLQQKVKDSEDLEKWKKDEGRKREKLNTELRKTQEERVQMKAQIAEIERQIAESSKPAEVDPSSIEDTDERRVAEHKQLLAKLDKTNKLLEDNKKELDQLKAKDKAREKGAEYGRYRNEVLDEFGYKEETELDTDSNKMLDDFIRAELQPRLSQGVTKEDFENAAKTAKNRVEHFRQLAREHKASEKANADKIIGAGETGIPEEIKLDGKKDDRKTRVEKLAEKYLGKNAEDNRWEAGITAG